MTEKRTAPVVLVVDDEEAIVKSLAIILRQHGFDAVIAQSAEEAVRMARESAPDCLVCDIVMGAMNGIDAAIAIRELCPECRILLMTGHGSASAWLESARERGFEFDVLAKPFHPLE